jgi:hypothetical protein
MQLVNAVRRHPIVTFFVLAYAISWAGLLVEAVGFLPSGPFFAALIVIPIAWGRDGMREFGSRLIRWRVRWYWYAIALGLPLAVHAAYVGLKVAGGSDLPSLTFTSLTTFLMLFAIRLVNPADGPLGEHPGWNGVALPGLQASHSPLFSATILGVLVAGWHLPIFFLEEGALRPSVLVAGLVTTIAVTFWYTWLFNHARGSILLVVAAHSVEGSIQYELGWLIMSIWVAVAVALVVFDREAWSGRAPDEATAPPTLAPRGAEPAPVAR